jgi:hypothetical protein
LGIDPSRYSLETTLKPFLQAAFGSRLNNIGEERDSVSWRLT